MNPMIFQFAPPILILLVIAGLFVFRIRRNWMLEQILFQPASMLSDQGSHWKSTLPKGIQLQSESPLFDVLYEAFKSKPELFDPKRVSNVLVEMESVGISKKFLPTPETSEEEQASNLISLHSYHHDPDFIPMEAVASSVLRNLLSVLNGKKKLKVGFEHAVLDCFGAGGGFAGAKLGGAMGMALTPFLATMAAIALPVFMIAGVWFGSIAGKRLGDRVKMREIHAAIKRLKTVSKDFRKSFLDRFPDLMEQLDHDFEARIAFTRDLYRKRQSRLLRLLFPDLLTVFFRMSVEKLRSDWREDKKQWKQIRKKIRFMHPLKFANALFQLGEKAFVKDPVLLAHYKAYEVALGDLQEMQVAHRSAA